MTIEEVLLAHPETIESGQRFQKQLADFIIEKDLQTIVETGSGTSSFFILKALEKRGSGFLYSIDPLPFCNYEIEHPMYALIKEKSMNGIPPLYQDIGAFDLALVDGDHDVACQVYDYEMMYACLRVGGWLVVDDKWWNNQTCWNEFVGKRGLKEIEIGNISAIQKLEDYVVPKHKIHKYSNAWKAIAQFEEEKWIALGNQTTFATLYPNRKK